MREVRVCDVTMKRAAGSKQLTLSFKEKLELAKLLDKLGVSAIEIEGITQSKADSLRIKSIASIAKNSTVAVPVSLDASDVEAVWSALKGAKHARLQVQAAVSPAQIEYIHRKKAESMLKAVADAVAACAKYTDDVEFIADDATRTDLAYLCSILSAAIEAGATSVTVCDAAGKMLPEEYARFIADLREGVPALANVSLGIGCSNDLYMADACTVAGVIAGVQSVKVTAYPMDVASLDKVARILSSKQDVCQATTTVRTTELKRATSQIAWICEGMHSKGGLSDGTKYTDESIVLTAQDTAETVMQQVVKLGYDLSEDDQATVYEAFLRIASKKESVGGRELDAIVASAALQVPPTYVLDRYVINSGNTIKATATVRIRKGDEVIERVGMGDGPIDAAFAAIELAVGRSFELDDWQMQSVTQGQEAMGEAVIKLSSQGKVYSGRGISTDILGSSIRAYINALNKVVYEEEN